MRSFLALAATIVVAICLSPLRAESQICDVDLLPTAGGTTGVEATAQTSSLFKSDPELEIEIAEDLSSVRLENSKIRVVYSAFFATHPEYAIKQFVIKEANEDQIGNSGDFMAAGAGRGPLASATVIVDKEDRKTVRLVWSRWSISAQMIVPSDQITIDVTIYPHQAFLQYDNVDIQWHSTVTDLGSPGGTTNGVHIAHGAAGWNRGYVSHDEIPYLGTYYDRHPSDGIGDPVDGGSLNYNGHFIMAVFNPANGRGFGRVLPVLDTAIIKLLLAPNTRRGLETAHYPFLNPHPPFTTYLFAIESGQDALAIGRSLADSGGVQSHVECGDVLQLTADPYTDWVFSNWTDDLAGDMNNPTTLDAVTDHSVGAVFDQAPGDYTNDFDALNPGDDPIDWFDTEAGNALTENDAIFEVVDLGSDRVFGTVNTSTNIHSHYVGGAGAGGLGYEVSGRLRVTDPDGGVGVTIFSQFPSVASYYRLRRLAGGSYHVAPFGTNVTGETDTGVVPLSDVWYRFRLQAEDTGMRTELRTMVWKDGFPEPGQWQVDVFDDSPTRLTGGSTGLWSLGDGGKYIDDVAVHVLLPPPTDLTLTVNEVGMGSVMVTPDQVEYTQGDVVTLEAIGSGGQVFAGWSGSLSGFENPTQLVMQGDETVTATFIVPTSHTLTLLANGQGAITANPDLAQYLLGDSVELTAVADPGWGFIGWDGALTGSQNPETLMINGDAQVEAIFAEFDLIERFESVAPGENAPDFLDTGAGNSLLEDDTLFSVELDGGEQVLKTTANQINIHSHYSGMQLDGLSSYEFTGRMRLDDLDGGVGVTFFSQMPGSLTYYRLRRYKDTSFHLAPVGSSLAGISDTGVMPLAGVWYEFKIQVDAGISATDVRAKVWAEGDPEPAAWQAEGSDSSGTRLTSGTVGAWGNAVGAKYWDDFEVRAIPPPPPTLSLNVSMVGSGSVTRTPDQPLYSAGEMVTLQATADPGYVFVGWSGAATGSNSSIDVLMDGNVSVTASFAEILPHPLTVTVAGDGMGTLSLSPDQPTYLTGDVVTLTATADPGSTFDGWTGDLTRSENPLQVTVLGPLSITANFGEPAYANGFEGVAVGASPTGWYDSAASNSLIEAPELFDVRDLAGERVFGTDSTETNIHSHFFSSESNTLSDYRYGGRFRISDSQAGIGITMLSQFPDQAAYYRLRSYQGTSFHLAPFGTQMTSGTTDTGVAPFAGVWYRFEVDVEDMGSETRVRAKVWPENGTEPEAYQVDAVDNSPTRLTSGSFGVWSLGPGAKSFDDMTISVPEPSAGVMLIAGAGLIGLLGRRRPHPCSHHRASRSFRS